MKQIIKEGTKKICDCPKCGCKFSYDREDAYSNQENDGVFVTCPQCEAEIPLLCVKTGFLGYPRLTKGSI